MKNESPKGTGDGLKIKDLKHRLAMIDEAMVDPQSKEALNLLLQAIQDESWHLRNYAAKAMTQVGTKVVSPLLKLLAEGVWYVRASAASALGDLGKDQAIDPLLRIPQREPPLPALPLLEKERHGPLSAAADEQEGEADQKDQASSYGRGSDRRGLSLR